MDQNHWQHRLALLADKHGVVGASLAIQEGADTVTAATGLLNARTGHPVTEHLGSRTAAGASATPIIRRVRSRDMRLAPSLLSGVGVNRFPPATAS